MVGPAQDIITDATAIYPKTDAVYDLGKVASSFDVAYVESINLAGTAITATAVELNYTDGVTSAIQTQLDAALPKAGGAMTGAITTNSTFDGVDIATRDGVLTTTTTTANAALPKAGGTMTGDIVVKGVTETNFALTGTTPAIDPTNGTIQTWTLTAASTPTFAAGWSANEGITLMIDDGTAYAITWPTMQWAGGTAPTLPTTGYGVVTIWKEGAVYYGVSAGDMA